jgi:hypothetical protein
VKHHCKPEFVGKLAQRSVEQVKNSMQKSCDEWEKRDLLLSREMNDRMNV